ncbi:MAG TPA: hypothetical protein PK400_02435 [Phycisphaerales bacterium]|nr:hypothetical protein [Phycisphaerales bacterium]
MGLAELAQRDIDAFLARKSQIEGEGVSTALGAPASREIIWHRPASPERAHTIALPGSLDAIPNPVLYTTTTPVPEVREEPTSDGLSPEPVASSLDRDRLRELLIELSKELYRDAAYSDTPLRELLLIAATTIVRPDRALSPDAIPGLTERERELLASFQQFFGEVGRRLDGKRGTDETLREAVDLLRAALHTEPRLMLDTVALCTRVGGFGDYDPFNKYAFLAHSEQKAIVYLEIANFTSELNAKNEWVTELSQQITIYSDRDGIPVWREDWQTAVDVTKNRRNDFFVVQIITLPKALSVGKYQLKVRVRDEKSKAEAEGTIHFELVADPKMAATVR